MLVTQQYFQIVSPKYPICESKKIGSICFFLIHKSQIITQIIKIIFGDVLYQNNVRKIKYFVICVLQKKICSIPKISIYDYLWILTKNIICKNFPKKEDRSLSKNYFTKKYLQNDGYNHRCDYQQFLQ